MKTSAEPRSLLKTPGEENPSFFWASLLRLPEAFLSSYKHHSNLCLCCHPVLCLPCLSVCLHMAFPCVSVSTSIRTPVNELRPTLFRYDLVYVCKGLVSKTDHIHRVPRVWTSTYIGGGRNRTCNTHPHVKRQTKGTHAELIATWVLLCGLPVVSLCQRRLKRSVCSNPGPQGKEQHDLPTSTCSNWKNGVLARSPNWLYSGATDGSWRHWICSQSIQARLWLSLETSGVCQIPATGQQASLCLIVSALHGHSASNSVSCAVYPQPCTPRACLGCPCNESSVPAHSLPNGPQTQTFCFSDCI